MEYPEQPVIGRVALSVSDLGRSLAFYERVIGLELLAGDGRRASLGVAGYPLLELTEIPGARRVRAAGLYHFALLTPSRVELARALAHYLRVDAPITGYADHAVSEAIYLSDPDGHGIEVYRDRPRETWQFPNGRLHMTTESLDLQSLLSELPEPPPEDWRLPPGTMMGHIHLQVADIAATERFYSDHLGFEVMVRYGPAATFLATNGYHHHIGANTWAGTGLTTAPGDASRLLWYEIAIGNDRELEQLAAQLREASIPVTPLADGRLRIHDPSGIEVHLIAPLG